MTVCMQQKQKRNSRRVVVNKACRVGCSIVFLFRGPLCVQEIK